MPALTDLRRAFRDAPTVSVATLLPDGSPHVVPLWFVWLEEAVYVSCRADSRVHRNLVRDPRVALSVDRGRTWPELDGVLIRGEAELLAPDHPGSKRATSAWFEKYRSSLAGSGFAAYTEQVAEPVLFRVRLDRVSPWSHASGGSQ